MVSEGEPERAGPHDDPGEDHPAQARFEETAHVGAFVSQVRERPERARGERRDPLPRPLRDLLKRVPAPEDLLPHGDEEHGERRGRDRPGLEGAAFEHDVGRGEPERETRADDHERRRRADGDPEAGRLPRAPPRAACERGAERREGAPFERAEKERDGGERDEGRGKEDGEHRGDPAGRPGRRSRLEGDAGGAEEERGDRRDERDGHGEGRGEEEEPPTRSDSALSISKEVRGAPAAFARGVGLVHRTFRSTWDVPRRTGCSNGVRPCRMKSYRRLRGRFRNCFMESPLRHRCGSAPGWHF